MDKLIISNLILLLLTVYANCISNEEPPNIRIVNVDRLIDISSQIVKVTNKITIENTGGEAIKSFVFGHDNTFMNNVPVFKARISDSDAYLASKMVVSSGHHLSWRIMFDIPLESGKTTVVDVYYVLINYLVPYPTQITQNEKQYVKFIGNSFVYMLYPIGKVTTSIALGTKNIESYTKVEPTSYSDSHILYGPYKDVPPLSISKIEIHYENNSPFLVASLLERRIEVSHWGNVAVEEDITLEHTGAKLKGPFSRYDYQREPESGLSSVKVFKTILPGTGCAHSARLHVSSIFRFHHKVYHVLIYLFCLISGSASDIYYRDEIGNISTSHLYNLENSVEVELRPRFPLFGGWNTRYTLGYNIPSYTCLYSKGDNYALKLPFIDHIFDNMVINKAIVKVILPEGAEAIRVSLPYNVNRYEESVHHTYLDTVGRPVLTLQHFSLVEDHIANFEVRYVFPKMYMLLEPTLIIGFLFILFLLVIVYVRLDFTLCKDEYAEQKLRVSGICSKFIGYQSRKIKLYENFDDKFTTAKYNPDLSTFSAAVKTFNNEYKNLSTQLADISTDFKLESPESVDKIVEIQKLDKQLKEIYSQQQNLYVEKLIPRKISKAAFLEAENSFFKKRDEYVAKIYKVIKSLE